MGRLCCLGILWSLFLVVLLHLETAKGIHRLADHCLGISNWLEIYNLALLFVYFSFFMFIIYVLFYFVLF